MPLVKIELFDNIPTNTQVEISDAIHSAIVNVLAIPDRDKFHVITTHAGHQIVAQDAGLGFERTAQVVIIQIFTQRGRSESVKQELFKAIAEELGVVGIPEQDVFIGYFENGPTDWSFGYGRAQYMTGELAVPGK